jgi:hypothetical protein
MREQLIADAVELFTREVSVQDLEKKVHQTPILEELLTDSPLYNFWRFLAYPRKLREIQDDVLNRLRTAGILSVSMRTLHGLSRHVSTLSLGIDNDAVDACEELIANLQGIVTEQYAKEIASGKRDPLYSDTLRKMAIEAGHQTEEGDVHIDDFMSDFLTKFSETLDRGMDDQN